MSANPDPMASPEWEAARADWRSQADASLEMLHAKVGAAAPGSLHREDVYAPIHDIAGLAGVFEYVLLTRVARAFMEVLRTGPDSLDQTMLETSRAYLTAMSALHARDQRGDTGPAGEALLARLAELSARA